MMDLALARKVIAAAEKKAQSETHHLLEDPPLSERYLDASRRFRRAGPDALPADWHGGSLRIQRVPRSEARATWRGRRRRLSQFCVVCECVVP